MSQIKLQLLKHLTFLLQFCHYFDDTIEKTINLNTEMCNDILKNIMWKKLGRLYVSL
jgi:hypothetical protein